MPQRPHGSLCIVPGSHSPHDSHVPPRQSSVPAQSSRVAHMRPTPQSEQSGPPQSTSVSEPPRTPSEQPFAQLALGPEPTQYGVDAPQVVPHAPQLVGSDKSVSHPFAAPPSQSPKPVLHDAIVHTPLAHAPVAFAGSQGVSHPPQ
jgi:hypothetical protein